MSTESPPLAEPTIQRVSTIELFFDLVFVFTLTQLTGLVAHPHGASDYLKTFLVCATLMWMYDGYTWLTSNLTFENSKQKKFLFVAMAGFFVMALSVPDVFGASGLPYALGFLTVITVHQLLFRSVPTVKLAALQNLAFFNYTAALLVLGAAFVLGTWDWLLWGGAVAVLLSAMLWREERNFQVSPIHFVERHGLLMIVALGESIVAVGVGAGGLPVDTMLVITAVLALFLSAGIWWSYFNSRDAERAEHQFVHASPTARNRMGGLGYGFAHAIMIFGIILIAAGLEVGIAHPIGHPEEAGIWNLAVGLAVYLGAESLYRHLFRLDDIRLRLILAVLVFATVPLGLFLGALAQIAACVLLLQLLWLLRDTSQPREESDERFDADAPANDPA